MCLPSPIDISVDQAHQEFHYVETESSLAEVVAELEAGTLALAVIRCTDERIRYALISSPLFNKPGLSKWMGTIKLSVENWSFVWDALLANPDLLFICVGDPEGVELCDEQISVDSFPWTEWPLLIGAMWCTQNNEWVVKRRMISGASNELGINN